jgi:hypothetical protein
VAVTSRRLHQALGYRAPMAVWRGGAARQASGHVDNASALTTCPQAGDRTAFVLRRDRFGRVPPGGELHLRDVGDDDPRASALEIGMWIELPQQVLRHVEFIGDFRERARVPKAGEARHRSSCAGIAFVNGPAPSTSDIV